jgi:short-subunit dehydrogenase
MFDAKKYGPWAVIAGASEGVGTSFAHKLGKVGINSVLIARKQNVLDEVAASVQKETGAKTRTLSLDLTAPDMLARIRAVTDDLEVGLVVYNAGANQGMLSFFEAPLEKALWQIALNPIGQTSLCHHFGAKMMARKRGGIILIGSLAANAGATPLVAYSASKAFTQSLAEGLWTEMKPHGVDVVYRVLGATLTANRARQKKPDPSENVEHPDHVAEGAMAAIANGPVNVPDHLAEKFHQLTTMPRGEAALSQAAVLAQFRNRPNA